MRCLKCGHHAVHYTNATDVGDSGGCTINCSKCGQPHSSSLFFDSHTVTLPMTLSQKALVYGAIVLVLAVACGLYALVAMFL